MDGLRIDYMAVYRQLPVPVVLLTPEFEIADANEAFLKILERRRGEVLGRKFLDAFPEDPATTGVRNSGASLQRVVATGEADVLEFRKYDFEVSPGVFARRYWSGVNAPVRGPDGSVVLIACYGEDVTDRLNRFMSTLAADADDEGPA